MFASPFYSGFTSFPYFRRESADEGVYGAPRTAELVGLAGLLFVDVAGTKQIVKASSCGGQA
jgi:hypothetical protein